MTRTSNVPDISDLGDISDPVSRSRRHLPRANASPLRGGRSALLCCVVALGACRTASGAGTTPSGPDEVAAVTQALTDACQAYREADIERMAFLLTEDFTTTDPDGVVTTRADDIEIARKGTIRYDVFENRDMKVRLHGSAAVVTGRTIVRGTAGDRAFDSEFQFTDTLVKMDGQWRVAATHISRISR